MHKLDLPASMICVYDTDRHILMVEMSTSRYKKKQ